MRAFLLYQKIDLEMKIHNEEFCVCRAVMRRRRRRR